MKRNLLQATNLSRREMLGIIGVTAAAPLVGCADEQSTSKVSAGTPACVVRPQQTEGPYFVDEKLNRTDIRTDPTDGQVYKGVPLRLALAVSRMAGNSCTPLRNALVDIWQCDALGVYSGVRDINGLFDTKGKKFLRGYQVTDANGKVEFITTYPGWYPGRTVHIHFKIRTDAAAGRGHEFTSQLYFDDAITDQVFQQQPYDGKGQRTIRNNRDGIFRQGGNQLMLTLTKETQGFAGTFDIGLQIG